VRVGQATWNRLDKAMLVSAWAPALAVLRSCLWHEVPGGGALNCGACEKCVRTMLMLLVHGALERAESFPVADVSPDLVASVAGSVTSDVLPFYPLLLGPLAGIGRADLVEAVEALIASFHARSGPTRRGWLDRLRRPGRG
jgi:hypothetical protein